MGYIYLILDLGLDPLYGPEPYLMKQIDSRFELNYPWI